jgi:hypothetical protein
MASNDARCHNVSREVSINVLLEQHHVVSGRLLDNVAVFGGEPSTTSFFTACIPGLFRSPSSPSRLRPVDRIDDVHASPNPSSPLNTGPVGDSTLDSLESDGDVYAGLRFANGSLVR